MSAVQPAETVASLVDALGTRHPILIHHDWSQQPDFSLSRPNVSYVENPHRTGWANWGFSQGILRLVSAAMEHETFDYFQLLSPTCLPVRAIEEYESHLESENADFFVDALRLDSEPNVLMSHGWRAYAAENTLHQRVLRRSRRWFLGQRADIVNRGGLSFPVTSLAGEGGFTGLKARIGLGITSLAKQGFGFDHVFSEAFRCYAGSTWFAASRHGCAFLLRRSKEQALIDYFSKMHMSDEIFFPSVFMNSGLKVASATHHIADFIDARPSWLQISDLDGVLASNRYFARKFPEDPGAAVRIELATRLEQKLARRPTTAIG